MSVDGQDWQMNLAYKIMILMPENLIFAIFVSCQAISYPKINDKFMFYN